MVQKNKYVSAQETRAHATREKLLKAAVSLVNQYGMKYLTVRNICDEAGLSTGSFYNLFSGKDDLIMYYLRYVFLEYKDQAIQESKNLNSLEKCLLIYRYYIRCCKEVGVEFVSALYAANTNPVFDFLDRNPEEALILDRVGEYIEEGKAKGEIRADVPTDIAMLRIATITTGSIFYWCTFKGDFDLAYQADDLMEIYLRSIAADPNISINLSELPREGKFSQY